MIMRKNLLVSILLLCLFFCFESCNSRGLLGEAKNIDRVLWSLSSEKNNDHRLSFSAKIPASFDTCRFILLHRKINTDINDSTIIDTKNLDFKKTLRNSIDLFTVSDYSEVGKIKFTAEILGMQINKNICKNFNYSLVNFDRENFINISSVKHLIDKSNQSKFISAVEFEVDDEDVYYFVGF